EPIECSNPPADRQVPDSQLQLRVFTVSYQHRVQVADQGDKDLQAQQRVFNVADSSKQDNTSYTRIPPHGYLSSFPLKSDFRLNFLCECESPTSIEY
ncbi:hypothetical protein BGZ65_012055, partial [Modicella reniformis]